MKPSLDLDELTSHIDFPDPLFQWSLELATGEIYPGPDENGKILPLPVLTELQVLGWMTAFSSSVSESRIQALLAVALKAPAPAVRFREVLGVNPGALEEWLGYYDQRRRAILIAWLETSGLG